MFANNCALLQLRRRLLKRRVLRRLRFLSMFALFCLFLGRHMMGGTVPRFFGEQSISLSELLRPAYLMVVRAGAKEENVDRQTCRSLRWISGQDVGFSGRPAVDIDMARIFAQTQ